MEWRQKNLILCVAVLLLLCCCCCAATSPVRLELHDSEFVWLHVGYPGDTLPFLVRWDVAAVYVPADSASRLTSQSYSRATASDMVCFETECVRMPLQTYAGDPAPAVAEPDMFALSGHSGVLGLGAGSPVRQLFPWIYADAATLLLYRQQPAAPRHALLADGNATLTLNGEPVALAVDLARCYSLAPRAAAEAHRWRLAAGAVRMDIDLRQQYVTPPAGGVVPAVLIDYEGAAAVAAATTTTTNASAVLLGRLMAYDLFGVMTGPTGATEWLVPRTESVPRVAQRDFAMLAAALAIIYCLWAVALHEDLWRSLVFATQAWTPSFALIWQGREYVSHEPLPTPTPPRAVALQRPRRLGFRDAPLCRALWLTLAVTCAAAAALCCLGIGRGRVSPEVQWSTTALLAVLCAIAYDVPGRPGPAIPAGAAASMMALWLLMTTLQSNVIVVIVLLCSGIMAMIVTAHTALAALLGDLVPPEQRRHRRSLYLFWAVVWCGVALATGALAGVYGVNRVLQIWWPAHPFKAAVIAQYIALTAMVALATRITEATVLLDLVTLRVTRSLTERESLANLSRTPQQ